jgi:spermidine/putrescine transport system substrate-binding protein
MPTQEYGRTRRNRPSCEHDEVLMYSIPALLLTVIVSLLLCHTTVAAGDPPELVVLNWPNYLDPELVDRFEQQHGVKVREVFFEGDDQRDEMLVNSDGAGYDVVLVSGNMLRTYMRSGWLQPMTEQQVPNLVHVAPRWRTAFAAADGFAAPYTWGTLGIGYREDLVPEPIDSWMQVFRPAPPLQGRMAMLSHNRDLVGMALMALGHSSNSHDEHELMQAEELLLAQRPHVRTYGYIGLNGDSAMVSGEIAAAMMFNGDALMLQEFEPRIRFIVPREGGNLWVDYFVVMSRSNPKGRRLRVRRLSERAGERRAGRPVCSLRHHQRPCQAASAGGFPGQPGDPPESGNARTIGVLRTSAAADHAAFQQHYGQRDPLDPQPCDCRPRSCC